MKRSYSRGVLGVLPILLALLWTQPLVAQSRQLSGRLGVSAEVSQPVLQDERPSRKEPGTATIISILIPGGGQIYSGETTRGLLMLGAAYGSIIVGAVASSCGSYDCSTTPLAVGLLGYLGIYVYSIVDASPSARRMNKKNGYKVTGLVPVIRSGPVGTSQLGLSVAF